MADDTTQAQLNGVPEDPEDTREALHAIAERVYEQLEEGDVPRLEVSSRSKSNIQFNEDLEVWKYGDSTSTRTAKKTSGAYMLLRTMYMVEFIQDMIAEDRSSTLREMYYISEGWDKAKFNKQDQSDRLAEDLEIMTRKLREDFNLRPEEDGARVMGDVTVTETTRDGTERTIHCRDDVGDAGYSIPYDVEPEKVSIDEVDVDFLLAIETGGMFDRLVENGFDETHDALLVHLKGQPARSTRRFVKRMNEERDLPVLVFTDADPWSYRIFASVAYGAIKSAHISEYLATPDARYLGVTPSDILNYELPHDGLTENDVNALESELDDPRFQDEDWRGEIELQLDIGKKSEQQALAKYGLDFVTDTYLPEKLEEMGMA